MKFTTEARPLISTHMLLLKSSVTDSSSKHVPPYSVGACSLQYRGPGKLLYTPLTSSLCEQGLLGNRWQFPKVKKQQNLKNSYCHWNSSSAHCWEQCKWYVHFENCECQPVGSRCTAPSLLAYTTDSIDSSSNTAVCVSLVSQPQTEKYPNFHHQQGEQINNSAFIIHKHQWQRHGRGDSTPGMPQMTTQLTFKQKKPPISLIYLLIPWTCKASRSRHC